MCRAALGPASLEGTPFESKKEREREEGGREKEREMVGERERRQPPTKSFAYAPFPFSSQCV